MKHECVAKLIGEDAEYGNTVLGEAISSAFGSGDRASRLLLREVPGVANPQVPVTNYGSSSYNYNPQDRERKYSPDTGGCTYIDLNHYEACMPEVTSAQDYVASTHAMQRLAAEARRAASARLPEDQRILVLANNSDGLGHSYGSHLNILVSRAAFDDIFQRVYPALLFIAAFQASCMIFTGQGKVGSEDSDHSVDYQLSQRADFIDTLVGPQTTHQRPMVNSRDEPLCGDRGSGLARLHCIVFDHALCDMARYLKAGTMQLVLAMVERGHVNPGLLLEHPVQALRRWSCDPSLRATARLIDGTRLTAVEHQQLFLEQARRFVQSGECEAFVPDAPLIVQRWQETLEQLQRRDWPALARRLDWVLKRTLIERTLDERRGLDWHSPEIKHLDLLYSSVDDDGLFQAAYRTGFVERLVSDAHIQRFTREPPDDTRAYTRAMLLRRWGHEVVKVDWDYVRFRDGTVPLPDPRAFTRAEMETLITEEPLDRVLALLGQSTASFH